MKQLTSREEAFCLEYYKTGNATRSAILAGYAPKTAGANCQQVLARPKVQAKLEDLRKSEKAIMEAIEAETVMSVLERKQRLTEIARARLTDFMELGQDGSWVNLGPETPGTGAIQEIHSRTEYDKDGAQATLHTSVKLHPPIPAIQELNKMEKLYAETPPGYQDNRQINIFVVDNETKDLISQVAGRTKSNNADAHNQSIQGSSESMGGREEGDTP